MESRFLGLKDTSLDSSSEDTLEVIIEVFFDVSKEARLTGMSSSEESEDEELHT